MFKKNYLRISLISLSVITILAACRKREAALPDTLANFESSAQGLEEANSSITIKVQLTRGTDRDVPVTINLAPTGLVYGTDFTTTPAAVSNKVTVTVSSGNDQATFTVSKVPGALFDGDERILLDLYSSGAPVTIGAKRELILSFKELVASSASLVLNGGGVLYPNRVFADLSANRQTPVLRTNWDLGFYFHPDSFRVVLNSSTAMMAKQLNKNDLTQVTAADTIGFSTAVAFAQLPDPAQLPYIDYPTGDLNRTAIASISANASENKVYIVNRGTGVGSPAPQRGWKKIRILRNGSGGFTLQYADIASATFQELSISKNDAYFYTYVSFENGIVPVEPEKKKWDIAWSYFANATNFGAGDAPYLYQDIIIQNRNVAVAKVMISSVGWDAFDSTHITAQTFSTSQIAIGADWRVGGGPGAPPVVRTDRFYVIKDGDNNYYKLRFTALTQNAERGYVTYEAKLVKRG